MGGRYRSLAAARARVVVAIVLAPALEVPPRHDHRARVLAPHVLDVALVRGLARGLAQVPADTSREAAKPFGGRRAHGPPLGLVVSDSRVKRSLRAVPPAPGVAPASTTRSSPVGNRPAGANRCDSTNGVSDVDNAPEEPPSPAPPPQPPPRATACSSWPRRATTPRCAC